MTEAAFAGNCFTIKLNVQALLACELGRGEFIGYVVGGARA